MTETAVDRELFEELRAALAAGSGRAPGEVPDAEVEACLAEVLAGERGEVGEVGEGGEAGGPAGASLSSRLEALAEEAPDAVAVAHGDATLSWSALHGRSGALAVRLRELGVAPGAPVALDLEPSIGLVVGLVGVLRAGATAVPLDAACPEAWRRRFARRAGAAALVRSAAGSQGDRGRGQAAAAAETEAEDATAGLGIDGPVVASPGEGVCAQGTSGEAASGDGIGEALSAGAALVVEVAGEPLVVEIGAVLRRLEGLASALALTDPVVLHRGAFAGDAWVAELLLPLVCGGRSVVAPRVARGSAAGLAAAVERTGATLVWATEEELAGLAATARVPEPGPGDLSSLAALVVAGGGPERRSPGAGAEDLPWTVLVTAAAPEAGGEVLLGVAAADAGADRPAALRPAGPSFPYVLDRREQPVPVGVWGELCAGIGDGVRGFAGSPAATAERFRPDPFGDRTGARMVATGLTGRLRSDGGYELGAAREEAGRRLRRHGAWIDRRRVEEVLGAEGGASACALGRSGDGRLIAWVETGERTASTEDAVVAVAAVAAVERAAAEHLAPWETPDLVAPCPALPRRSDGGVARPDGPTLAALEAAARRLPVAVAATFTAKPLAEPLGFLLETVGLAPEIRFAPYSQVIQELLRPDGTLASVKGGWNVLLVRLEDWAGNTGAAGAPSTGNGAGGSLMRETVEALLAALEQRSGSSPDAPPPSTLLVVCPPPADQDGAVAAEHRQVVDLLAGRLERLGGVRFLDCSALAEVYAVAEPDDFRADELGHIPYTGELFAALAAAVARQLSAELVPGPAAVAVGRLAPEVAAADALKEFLAAQRATGREVCQMGEGGGGETPAGSDAAGTLRGLAAELGISLEEWVYLGTDAAEHAAIVEDCDEALALRLPADPEGLRAFLGHLWPFDSLPRPAARPRGGAES